MMRISQRSNAGSTVAALWVISVAASTTTHAQGASQSFTTPTTVYAYERFEQLNPHGSRDAAGIREFVVGTGGATLYGVYRPSAHSSVRRAEHGVLALSLTDESYSWEFRTVDNEVIDRGQSSCHAKTATAP